MPDLPGDNWNEGAGRGVLAVARGMLGASGEGVRVVGVDGVVADYSDPGVDEDGEFGVVAVDSVDPEVGAVGEGGLCFNDDFVALCFLKIRSLHIPGRRVGLPIPRINTSVL